jgi:hypothetical protein
MFQKGDIVKFKFRDNNIQHYLLMSESHPLENKIHYEALNLMTGTLSNLHLIDGDKDIQKVA